ncbi:FKBP-type peptidyl-prolyl cis-trans isomerase [Mariniflexile sp. HMF6888]|uniref:FKBP-type peptidyl-prolyl cis-trans isomerase n=1 Tax=Mariniflexile sp. HMF6888 TaxID=3373086 RepID=UPI003789D2C9
MNEQQISDYIAENNLVGQRSDRGLYYIIEEPGTGDRPTSTSNVTVACKGYFLDGSVFDQSNVQAFHLICNKLLEVGQKGLPILRKKEVVNC